MIQQFAPLLRWARHSCTKTGVQQSIPMNGLQARAVSNPPVGGALTIIPSQLFPRAQMKAAANPRAITPIDPYQSHRRRITIEIEANAIARWIIFTAIVSE